MTPPLELTDVHRRRLFAQEFTTQLQRVGSASLREMKEDFRLELFKIEAKEDELRQVADIARRHGWLSAPDDRDGGEWSLTERGAALTRPPSLGTPQIAARLLSVIKPVREQATAFLPIVALVAGGLAAFESVTTLTAVRILAIAVLAWTFAIQLWGEAQIIRAVRSWQRLTECGASERDRRVVRFYGWVRFGVNVVFLIGVVTAFGLGIFSEAEPFRIVGGAAAALGVGLIVYSLRTTFRRA